MRGRIFIILILILLILVGLGVFWFLTKNVEEGIGNLNYSLPAQNLNNNLNVNYEPEIPSSNVPEISEEEKLKAELSKMAISFAERYGSYSNQSNFENLEDLLPFMSTSLSARTEIKIKENRAQASEPALYYGIITKVLNAQLLTFSEVNGQATLKLATQRQEMIGSSVNKNVYYADLKLEFVRESGIWKVNRAIWL